MTFNHAHAAFVQKPCSHTAAELLRTAREYEADDLIDDDTFYNTLSELEIWLRNAALS